MSKNIPDLKMESSPMSGWGKLTEEERAAARLRMADLELGGLSMRRKGESPDECLTRMYAMKPKLEKLLPVVLPIMERIGKRLADRQAKDAR
jgi:hypothetical protein